MPLFLIICFPKEGIDFKNISYYFSATKKAVFLVFTKKQGLCACKIVCVYNIHSLIFTNYAVVLNIVPHEGFDFNNIAIICLRLCSSFSPQTKKQSLSDDKIVLI